jgi:hypothetical protein
MSKNLILNYLFKKYHIFYSGIIFKELSIIFYNKNAKK